MSFWFSGLQAFESNFSKIDFTIAFTVYIRRIESDRQ